MGYTHFDKLSAINGFYVGPSGQQKALTGLFEPGNQFFVDSGATGASDNNDGLNWATPLATLDAAIGKCTANNGDIIWIAPGHAESWTTTGTKVTADIAGIRIIGLGEGASRPTFTFGHTGTTWAVSAASVLISNLLFVANVDLITTLATISGADCTIHRCEFRDATDKEVIDTLIVTGDRFQFIDCFHNGYTGGDANARVLKMNGVDNALIKGCRFMGKVTTAVINFVTTACTNVLIEECDFLVTGTTSLAKDVVDTIGGSTWEVADCFDLAAGSGFSGGSGGALAKDDVGAVTASIGTLANTGGTATLGGILGDPSNVSFATNLAKIGTLANTGGTATVGGILGDVANMDVATRLKKLTQSTSVALVAADLTGTTTRFTVAGGPVKILHMGLLIGTALSAGANTLKLSFTPTGGAATDLSGATDTASAAANTIFALDGVKVTGLVKVTDAGIMVRANESAMPIILSTGVIQTIFSAGPPASGTGTLYVEWEPLVPGATVS